jgi:hypothetical protein
VSRTLENYLTEVPAASGTLDQTDGILCLEDDEIKMATPPQVNTAALWLPGTSGNYVSCPDAAGLDIVGDICVVAKVALDDWTPADYNTIAAKSVSSGDQISWSLRIAPGGLPQFFTTSSGNAATIALFQSSAAPAVSDTGTLWIAITVDVDNGASGCDGRFWTSSDGETWTQLGATQTGGSTISVFSSTSAVEIGSRDVGTVDLFVGRVHNVSVRSGIGASGVVGGSEVLNYSADLARGQRYRDAYGNLFTHTGSAWALMAA